MKYDRMERNTYETEANSGGSVVDLLTADEKFLWSGKPKKSIFIIENILSMLPFALIWLAFDLTFIVILISNADDIPSGMLFFLIPFFALHLMPVWIWLSKVITANRRYKNTEYCITDKRVIIKSGFVGMQVNSIMMKDIVTVDYHRGILDTMFGVGDVYIRTSGFSGSKVNYTNSIMDIPDALDVMKMIQKVSYDVKADISYPNAMRPEDNSGYKTQYNPDDVFTSGSGDKR